MRPCDLLHDCVRRRCLLRDFQVVYPCTHASKYTKYTVFFIQLQIHKIQTSHLGSQPKQGCGHRVRVGLSQTFANAEHNFPFFLLLISTATFEKLFLFFSPEHSEPSCAPLPRGTGRGGRPPSGARNRCVQCVRARRNKYVHPEKRVRVTLLVGELVVTDAPPFRKHVTAVCAPRARRNYMRAPRDCRTLLFYQTSSVVLERPARYRNFCQISTFRDHTANFEKTFEKV